MVPLSRERKSLLICGIVLLLVGAVYRFSPNIPSVFSGSDEMSFKEKELLRYRKVLQEKKRLEATLLSRERELARVEAGLLSRGTPALAAVDIQSLINDIAGQKMVTIQSTRVLQSKPTENEEYISVPVQVNMIAAVQPLVDILFFIENSAKLLKITNIRIRLPNVLRPEDIYCQFTVEGLMKNEER